MSEKRFGFVCTMTGSEVTETWRYECSRVKGAFLRWVCDLLFGEPGPSEVAMKGTTWIRLGSHYPTSGNVDFEGVPLPFVVEFQRGEGREAVYLNAGQMKALAIGATEVLGAYAERATYRL